VRTPHLDALAADGIRFTNAFCTAPQCSPSRASLFTGRTPHNNGVMGLTHANFAWDLAAEERHLGQVLHDNGYATALIGVHHESRMSEPEQIAQRCGMEDVFLPNRGEILSEKAIHLLARYSQQERPFYLQLGYVEPHRLHAEEREEPDYLGFLGDYVQPDASLGVTIPPYLRETAKAREELAELQGLVHYLDTSVGQVLDGLKELGLEESTLVIFTTDHGLALPRAKCSLYDPGLEITLILKLPARGWRGGHTQTEMVSNLDLFPTLLELVGIPVGREIQGRSLLPLLDGGTYDARGAIFGEMTYHNYYDPCRCIRTARYKLIVFFSAAPQFMDPSQSWRPRTDPMVPTKPALGHHPLMELYDLLEDPWERENLAADPEYAEVRSDLLSRLYRWMRETDDPLLQGAVTSPLHRWAVDALSSAGTKRSTD